jgi:ketosteroid isomerase-like protein
MPGVPRDPALQELLDKQAIREATMRYARGVDRLDAELVSSAYHPDARDDRGGHIYVGATVGPEMVKSLAASMQSTSHQLTTQSIDVHGDNAACETYSTGRHILKDGRGLHTLVRYIDRFERRADAWKIIHRLVIVDAADILPPPEGADFNVPALGRRDKSDPSYAVFQR